MKFDHYKDVECFEYLEVYVHKTPLLEDILLEIVSEIQHAIFNPLPKAQISKAYDTLKMPSYLVYNFQFFLR